MWEGYSISGVEMLTPELPMKNNETQAHPNRHSSMVLRAPLNLIAFGLVYLSTMAFPLIVAPNSMSVRRPIFENRLQRQEEPPPLLEFRPEYDRFLSKAIVGATGTATGALFRGGIRIVEALPSYTDVTLLTCMGDHGLSIPEAEIVELRKRRPALSKRLHVVAGRGPAWIQDFGEGAGNQLLFGSSFYEGAWEIELAEAGYQVVKHALSMSGGNIQLARDRDGRRLCFIGEDEFSGFASSPNTRAAIIEQYRMTFGADRVVVLPNMETEHIDQMVMFLRDGLVAMEALPELDRVARHSVIEYMVERANLPVVAGLERIGLFPVSYTGETREIRTTGGVYREVLPSNWMPVNEATLYRRLMWQHPALFDSIYTYRHEQHRRQIAHILEREGFSVLKLKTTVWHDLNCMSFVNGQPFRNRSTGRQSVLLPVYHLPGQHPATFLAEELSGVNAENVRILEEAGLDVMPVQSVFRQGGNLHCMIYNLE